VDVSEPSVQELVADTRAPAAARAMARRWLPSVGADGMVADALLLVSELVANAVTHATTSSIRVGFSADDRAVRCEVKNVGTGTPTASDPPAGSVSGRGLFLVDRLASRWGSSGSDGSTTVWFELDR
jgi:anti-sigma regulatory factor (Ser/Thr protein kinase)